MEKTASQKGFVVLENFSSSRDDFFGLFTCVGVCCNYGSFWRDCLLVDQLGQGTSMLTRKPYGDVFISAFPLSIFVYIKCPRELLLLLIDWPQWKSNLFDEQFRLAWREGDEINRADGVGVLRVSNCSIEPEKAENPSLFACVIDPAVWSAFQPNFDIETITFHWPNPTPEPHFQIAREKSEQLKAISHQKANGKGH